MVHVACVTKILIQFCMYMQLSLAALTTKYSFKSTMYYYDINIIIINSMLHSCIYISKYVYCNI